jgi:pyrroline-5-carboxylate reductase
MKKIAFIGAGNMGGAVLRSALNVFPAEQFIVTVKTQTHAASLRAELGVEVSSSNLSAAERSEIIFLCVKPQYSEPVLAEIAPAFKDGDKTLVSIMAGKSTEWIACQLGLPEGSRRIVRTMPNLPALIGRGMTLIADGSDVPEEVTDILAQCGAVEYIAESLFDIGGVVAGCTPAWAAMFAESLADAGVAAGLSRAVAVKLAASAIAGTAEMIASGAYSPGALKDAVCSPGGTTIRGVAELERGGFRAAAINAVLAAYDKHSSLRG